MSTDVDNNSGVASPIGIGRRAFLIGAVGLLAVPGQALAQGTKRTFKLEERFLPQRIVSPYDYPAGTIVVVPRDKYLYSSREMGGRGATASALARQVWRLRVRRSSDAKRNGRPGDPPTT